MAKKSSVSSRRAKLISASAESIFSKPPDKRQKNALARLAKRQACFPLPGARICQPGNLLASALREAILPYRQRNSTMNDLQFSKAAK